MNQPQSLKQIHIYPGANATFRLYEDDGNSDDFEHGGGRITMLQWDDRDHRFTHTGAEAWTKPDSELVTIIHAAN